MAENKKSVWMTLPGLISGIAATITGLAVLIPLLLGVGGKHTNKNAASQNSSPGVTSSATGGTSTAGGGTGGTGGPSPTDSTSGSTSSPLGITADPSSVNLSGKAADATVTITNPGSTDVTFDKVEITGSNAAAFSITSTTCGNGSTASPNQSCQVVVHYTSPALGSASAALVVHYEPPQSSFITIQLKGSGGLLGG
ncbi:MAG: choice-of-anchor D domain-containing protein [Actinobacteria bacterium]|nr:MAG: choice-of-anchor D domain-containing protein [Actinomycetota bacterium]